MPPIEVRVEGVGSTGVVPEIPGEYPSQETDSGRPVFTVEIADLVKRGTNGRSGIKLIEMRVEPFSDRYQTVRFNHHSQVVSPEAEITFPGGEQKARVTYHPKK